MAFDSLSEILSLLKCNKKGKLLFVPSLKEFSNGNFQNLLSHSAQVGVALSFCSTLLKIRSIVHYTPKVCNNFFNQLLVTIVKE